MIDIIIKVFELPKGLQVRVQAVGVADSPRAAIYYQKLEAGIKAALLEAGAEVAKQGLGASLSPDFVAGMNTQAPNRPLDRN